MSFSSIDLTKSTKSALGFALDSFAVADPKTAKLSDIQDELNVYLAMEAGLRVSRRISPRASLQLSRI